MITTRRFLRDRRRALLWWAFGTVALVVSTTALFPSVEGNESFEQLAEELPETVTSLFGIDAAVPLTSAAGFLHTRLFSTLLPVVLLLFAVGLGTRALAGAEEDGTLELTLAHPVTRRRLALERYAAVAASVMALACVGAVTLVASAAPVGALDDVSLPGLLVAVGGAGSLALFHATLAFAGGALTGRRSTATGTAATVAVAGYLIYALLGVTDALDGLRFFTPWHWYLGRNMLAHGPAPDAVLVPLALSAILVAVGVHRFERRDLR